SIVHGAGVPGVLTEVQASRFLPLKSTIASEGTPDGATVTTGGTGVQTSVRAGRGKSDFSSAPDMIAEKKRRNTGKKRGGDMAFTAFVLVERRGKRAAAVASRMLDRL